MKMAIYLCQHHGAHCIRLECFEQGIRFDRLQPARFLRHARIIPQHVQPFVLYNVADFLGECVEAVEFCDVCAGTRRVRQNGKSICVQ